MQEQSQHENIKKKRRVETRVMNGGEIMTLSDWFSEDISDSEAIEQLRQRITPQPTPVPGDNKINWE